MFKITVDKLHHFLTDGANDCETYEQYLDLDEVAIMSRDEFLGLKEQADNNDFMTIVADVGMSEWHLGGDDVVDIVNDVLNAQKAGYAIATWYGEDTEVLVVGYRDSKLEIDFSVTEEEDDD